jgi:ABC-type transport system involved in multi-copper enzyme maturation permease subunit
MFAVSLSEGATYAGLGLIAIVAAMVAIVALLGLFGARSLVKRELTAYFVSPVAYVMLVVFLLVFGLRFHLTFGQLTRSGPHGVEWPMQYLFALLPTGSDSFSQTPEHILNLLSSLAFWVVYLLIPPLLTMRLFAEERSTGTLEMLMTAPLRDWQVVLSKFVACFAFYLLLWIPTLVFLPPLLGMNWPTVQQVWTPYSVAFVTGLVAVVLGLLLALPRLGTFFRGISLVLILGGVIAASIGGWQHYSLDQQHVLTITSDIDPWPVACTYLGLILVGAMLLALGMLVSSLVRSQLVAALLSVAFSLALLIAGVWRPFREGGNEIAQYIGRILEPLGVPEHISQDFGRGLLDTRHIVLYLSVAVFCLFLTVRSVEARRWQ